MKDAILYSLSLLILGAWFYATYFIFSGKIDTTNQTMLLQIGTAYGSVSTMAGGISAYWFGTSKSSSDKDRVLSEAVKSADKPQP